MILRRLAALRVKGAEDEEVGIALGLSPETIRLLCSSDAFKALEREEVVRMGRVGARDE